MRAGWKLDIDSSSALKKAAVYYHDQHFDLDNVIFDEEKKEFSIEYWRVIFEEAKRKRDYILYQIFVAPIIRTKLIFQHVYETRIRGEEPDDIMTDIRYDSAKGEIRFRCSKSTKIVLRAKKLDGIVKDVDKKLSDAYKFKTLLYLIETAGPVLPPHN